MATILVVSKQGDGVPLGLRMVSEGHIVKFFITDQKAKNLLQGYKNPARIGDPLRFLDQYDLVLADMAELGNASDTLSSKGKLVVGGGSFNDKLELDREYGERVAKSLTKLTLPKNKVFEQPKELAEWLAKADKAQVIKPFNNKKTSLTLVGCDPKNRTLQSIVQTQGKDLVPCLVQDHITGIEISTEGWFNGKEWTRPFNHTIEFKRFMENNKGCNTGCMGNVVWPTQGDKLTSLALEPLAPLLEKVNYIGPLDVNVIVTEQDAYWLEWTPRFGYEAIQTWMELIKLPLFEYLYRLASRQTNEFEVYDELAIGVRLSIAPYPNLDTNLLANTQGVQVVDVPQEARKHVWLADVMKRDDVEVLAGVDGVVGCVTARGATVRECQRRAYRTVKNICISDDVQYRCDIGDQVEEQRKQLNAWGWIQ